MVTNGAMVYICDSTDLHDTEKYIKHIFTKLENNMHEYLYFIWNAKSKSIGGF